VDQPTLEESQLVEQLYNNAGLDPVIDAGLKDYDQILQKEDKFINKVFGPRGTDIRGYGTAVAKRVTFAVYDLLNKQYGGKVGDLRSYIMALEEERDRANTRYDELMGRVVGILGDEYRDLRADSKEFMEKLTGVLGEDLKEARIDKTELAERLADIDGLRTQVRTLTQEKEQQKEKYESQIITLRHEHKEETTNLQHEHKEETANLRREHKDEVNNLQKEHHEEVTNLKLQIADLESQITALTSEKSTLTEDLTKLTDDYEQLKTAIAALPESVSHDKIGEKLGAESYDFVLKDSKVPDKVIDGIGKFIDFRKYFTMASSQGAQEAIKQVRENLNNILH
jgi:hypothetical protein